MLTLLVSQKSCIPSCKWVESCAACTWRHVLLLSCINPHSEWPCACISKQRYWISTCFFFSWHPPQLRCSLSDASSLRKLLKCVNLPACLGSNKITPEKCGGIYDQHPQDWRRCFRTSSLLFLLISVILWPFFQTFVFSPHVPQTDCPVLMKTHLTGTPCCHPPPHCWKIRRVNLSLMIMPFIICCLCSLHEWSL